MNGGETKLDAPAMAVLADLRRKQRLAVTFTLAFLAISIAMAIAAVRGFAVVLGLFAAPLVGAVVVIWAGMMIFLLRSFASTCPRCGEKFFVKAKFPRWHNNLAQQCMNCGLSLHPSEALEEHPGEPASA